MGVAWSSVKNKPSPKNTDFENSDEYPPSYYLRDPNKKWLDTENSALSDNDLKIKDEIKIEKSPDEGNATSVEAISDRLGEVTHLAEQLDIALCSAQAGGASSSPVTPNIKQILDGTATTTPQEWYSSLKHSKTTPNTSGDSKSEDEFLTASECTCTPPSRSSSFQTASEGGAVSPWWDVEPNSDTDEKTKTLTRKSEVAKITRELTSEVTTREISNQPPVPGDHVNPGLTSYMLENSLRPDMAPTRTTPRESSDDLSRTSEIVKQLSQIVQNNEETSRDIDTSSQYSSELLNPETSHTKSLSFETDNTDLSLPRFSSAAPQVTKLIGVKKPTPSDDDAAYRKEIQRFTADDNAKIYIIDASTPSPKSQRYLETSFDLYDEPRDLENRISEVRRKPLTIDLQGACALPQPDYYCPATLKRMAIQGIF